MVGPPKNLLNCRKESCLSEGSFSRRRRTAGEFEEKPLARSLKNGPGYKGDHHLAGNGQAYQRHNLDSLVRRNAQRAVVVRLAIRMAVRNLNDAAHQHQRNTQDSYG
jgi:hypothetical protein